MPTLNLQPAPLCHDFVLAKCERGETCTRSHPENLDPDWDDMDLFDGFRMPNEPEQACLRCMQRLYPACSLSIKYSFYF